MTGRYIYGDLCAQELRSFLPDGDRAEDDDTAVELAETIISLGQDRAGELYLLGSAGGLYRLDPAGWNAPPNPQKPTGPKQTTTTIARTTQNCDGVVAATEPLARIGAMTPEELQSAFEEANAKLASLVPTLPDSIKGDAEIVQQVLVDISTALASDDWDPGATALDQLRSEAYQGTGRFSEFPEAMARIVDSECG